MSRILVYESRLGCEECRSQLEKEGREIILCRDREGLVDSLLERRPDAVVYVLGELAADLTVLSLLRRSGPTLPIIVIGGSSNLVARRSVQDLKPTYFGVLPLEPMELQDAVQGALDSRIRWSR